MRYWILRVSLLLWLFLKKIKIELWVCRKYWSIIFSIKISIKSN